jgi:hypothetical protein
MPTTRPSRKGAHLDTASQGKAGLGVDPDRMVELDGYVGQLLRKLDDLGVAVGQAEARNRSSAMA